MPLYTRVVKGESFFLKNAQRMRARGKKKAGTAML